MLHPELLNDRQRRNASFALEEAVSLADALPGFEVQGSEIVRISKPQPGHLVGSGKMEELADRLKASIDVYLNSSSGMLISREDRLNTSLTDISDDRSDVLERMSELEERYTKQFTAMDTLVGQLQSTSDFLTQQIDAIKAAANR